MQEPNSRNESSRVFLLTFRGVEVFYSAEEDRIFSAMAPSPVEDAVPQARAEAAKTERKTTR